MNRVPLLLGAIAGVAAVFALRDVIAGSPGATAWVRSTLEPLSRARLEGYLPTSHERLRLAILIGLVAIAAGWWFGGPVFGIGLAVGAPLLAGWLIARGRRRYRRSVERSLPEISRAIADCLSAGHSPRGAIAAATTSLEGPARSEFAGLRYELETGRPTGEAIRGMAARFRSTRVDAFATALVSQQLAGGDLAGLLRRFAEGAAERDRVAEDARSATAQARFTGYLVVAMPAGAALFTELLRPGFIGSILASSAALIILGLSVLFQLGGFVAISKLARVGEP
ncbi:MAG: type II secretion system F family protein [Actinomycetota bacterium]|nr:type II secretion system F family protein [Actinomycetota bacterium]